MSISAVHTYLLILVGILCIAIPFISCYNLDLLSLFQNTLLGFSLFGLKEIGEYRLSEQREHPNEWVSHELVEVGERERL